MSYVLFILKGDIMNNKFFKTECFKNINPGDYFAMHHGIFIKLDSTKYTAIGLQDGYVYYFDSDDLVNLLNMELTIKPWK